jgi:hypothetical protein
MVYNPENPRGTTERLFVGSLKLHRVICRSGPVSQRSCPKAKVNKMDIFNRQWIEWSEPLNEIFGFAGMPFDDLTKPDSISRPGDKLWWLTNDNTK